MDLITCKSLGTYGRFGNCIFQSAFLACYARMHNLGIQATRFQGQDIFNLRFGEVTDNLPRANERYEDGDDHKAPLLPVNSEFVNKDWKGYGQFHTAWYAPHKPMLQGMFASSKRIDKYGFRIGIHYRGGDYNHLRGRFWPVPIQWYIDWLEDNVSTLNSPSLFVASEEPQFVDKLQDYYPLTCEKLGIPSTDTNDWQMLRLCDIVLCPNSTFSITAAMMNPTLKEAWRASLPDGKFIQYDPWNTQVLLPERTEDYRNP